MDSDIPLPAPGPVASEVLHRFGVFEGMLTSALARLTDHIADDQRNFNALRSETRDLIDRMGRDLGDKQNALHQQNMDAIERLGLRVQKIEGAAEEVSWIRRALSGEQGAPGMIAQVRELVEITTQRRAMWKILGWFGGGAGLVPFHRDYGGLTSPSGEAGRG